MTLQRHTPMRRTPLRRSTGRPMARPRDTGPDKATRDALWARAAGCCELCGLPIGAMTPFSRHHRLPRGRGGRNGLDNLLLLCGTGVTGCHGRIESNRTDAYDSGWLVRTGFAPAEVPVHIWSRTRGGRLVYLTSDGDYADGAP